MEEGKIDYKLYPDKEYKYFLYDPEGGDWYYFKTIEDRERMFWSVKDGFLDDYWDEAVENIIAGEITHTTSRVDYKARPDNLDENNCDKDGMDWRDWQYICDYALVPLESREASS